MSTGEQMWARGGLTEAPARRYRLGPRIERADSQPVSAPTPPRVDALAARAEQRVRFRGMFSLAPAWLVSLVVHLLAVNVLAVFCLVPQAPVDRRTIVASTVVQQSPVETLDAVALEIAPLATPTI